MEEEHEIPKEDIADTPSGLFRLPTELRLMIWNFAIPTTSKVIILDISSPIKDQKLIWNNIFRVCQESREVALRAMRTEKERNPNFNSQGLLVDIDFEQDIFRILKADWLEQLERQSVQDIAIVQRAQRLIVPLEVFKSLSWCTINALAGRTLSQRLAFQGHPNTPILSNCFTLLKSGSNFDDHSKTFPLVRELIVILDDENEPFRDIMRIRALKSNDPAIYRKMYKFSHGKYHVKMRSYLRSKDWQKDCAATVLAEMKTTVRNSLQKFNCMLFYHRMLCGREQQTVFNPSVPYGRGVFGYVAQMGGWPLNWREAKTPSLSVWYPGENAKFTMTDRGDLDNKGEFVKDGIRKPWANFIWPTVKVEYTGGVHGMKKLSCEVFELMGSN